MTRPRPSGLPALLLAAFATTVFAAARATLADLPLEFEANIGQFDAQVRFATRGSGYAVTLRDGGEARIHSAGGETVTMRLLGGSASHARGSGLLPGKTHRYADKHQFTGISNYGRVEWSEVYPGVDLVYYGAGSEIEYDFVVHPGADPRQIRIAFEGGDVPRLDGGGLVLRTRTGEVRLRTPRVYQQRGARRVEIGSRYRLDGRIASFEIAAHDPTTPLVIDPVIKFSTYLGGSGSELSPKVAADTAGAVYVGGYTDSSNFVPGSTNATGIYLTKINAAGTAREYSTFLSAGNVRGLAADPTGGLYALVDGNTSSLPGNAGRFAPVRGVALLRLTPSGTVDWSTGFGEPSADGAGVGLALDTSSNVYCLIQPSANRYPTTAGAFKPQPAATAAHVFVIKMNATGTTRLWATYLGNSIASEQAAAIAVDAAGSAVVAGTASNQGVPSPTTANGYRRTFRSGSEGWLVKLSPDAATLDWATLLVGRSNSSAEAVAVDASGRIYTAGATESPTRQEDFPLAEGQSPPAAGSGAGRSFLAVFAPDGSLLSRNLTGATTGSVTPARTQLAVTPGGAAWIAAQISGGPTAAWPLLGAFDSNAGPGGAFEAWIYRITGGTLDFATYYGGSGSETPFGIAASGASAWVVGNTASNDLDVTGALDTVRSGDETFLVKIGPRDYAVQLTGLSPLTGPPGALFSVTAGLLPEFGPLVGPTLFAFPPSGAPITMALEDVPVSGSQRSLRFRVPPGTARAIYRLELRAQTSEGGSVTTVTPVSLVVTDRGLTLSEPRPTFGFPGVTVFEMFVSGFEATDTVLLHRLTAAPATGEPIDWQLGFESASGTQRRVTFVAAANTPPGEYRLNLAIVTSSGASLATVDPEPRVLIVTAVQNSQRAVSNQFTLANGIPALLTTGQNRAVSHQFTAGNQTERGLAVGQNRAVSSQFVLSNAPAVAPGITVNWLRGVSSQFTLRNSATASEGAGRNRAVSMQFTVGNRSTPSLETGLNRAVSRQFALRNRNSRLSMSRTGGPPFKPFAGSAEFAARGLSREHELTVPAGELLTLSPSRDEWPPFTSFEYRLQGQPVASDREGVLRFLAPFGLDHFRLEIIGKDAIGGVVGQIEQAFNVVPPAKPARHTFQLLDEKDQPVANQGATIQMESWAVEYFDYVTPLVAMPESLDQEPARTGTVAYPQLLNPGGVFGRDPLGTGLWPDYVARFTSNLVVGSETMLDLETTSTGGAEIRINGEVVTGPILLKAGTHKAELRHWVGSQSPSLTLTNAGATLLPVVAAVTLTRVETGPNGGVEIEAPKGAAIRAVTGDGQSGWVTPAGRVTVGRRTN